MTDIGDMETVDLDAGMIRDDARRFGWFVWAVLIVAVLAVVVMLASVSRADTIDAAVEQRIAEAVAPLEARIAALESRISDLSPPRGGDAGQAPAASLSITGPTDGQYTATAQGVPAGDDLVVWAWSPVTRGDVLLGSATVQADGRASVTVTPPPELAGGTLIADVLAPGSSPGADNATALRSRVALPRMSHQPPDSAQTPNTPPAVGVPPADSGDLLAGVPGLTRRGPLTAQSGQTYTDLIIEAEGDRGVSIPAGTRDVTFRRVYVVGAVPPGGRGGGAAWLFGRGCRNITLDDCGVFDSGSGPGHGRRYQAIFLPESENVTIRRFVGVGANGPERLFGEKYQDLAGSPDDIYSHGLYSIDAKNLIIDGFVMLGGDGQVIKVVGSRPGGASGIVLRNVLGYGLSMLAATGTTDSGFRVHGHADGLVRDYSLEWGALVRPDGMNGTSDNHAFGVFTNNLGKQHGRVANVWRCQYDPADFIERHRMPETRDKVVLKPLIDGASTITITENVQDLPGVTLIPDILALIAKVRRDGYGDWCHTQTLMIGGGR